MNTVFDSLLSTSDILVFLLYGRDLHTLLDLLLTSDAGPAPHSM